MMPDLRDWFAMHAVSAMVGSYELRGLPTGEANKIIVVRAYDIADAMMVEREKRMRTRDEGKKP